jgi:aminoglycoside phosphotransferase (APT) family kinase protein
MLSFISPHRMVRKVGVSVAYAHRSPPRGRDPSMEKKSGDYEFSYLPTTLRSACLEWSAHPMWLADRIRLSPVADSSSGAAPVALLLGGGPSESTARAGTLFSSEMGPQSASLLRLAADLQRFLGSPVERVRLLSGGHSGLSYWVDLPGRLAVMRLPPPGVRVTGPADISRQGRIISELSKQGLPVPRLIASSAKPVIDERPFYLVEAIEGDRVEQASQRMGDADLVRAAILTLKQIHSLPVAHTGIGAEPAASPLDEIDRWGRLMSRAPAVLTRHADQLAALLRSEPPEECGPVLVHGDYHFGNMLFRGSEIVAVLDWEIAEIGQALVDVAGLAIVSRLALPGGPRIPGSGDIAVPAREVMVEYDVNLDASDFAWYLGLAAYKYAAILGYNLSLHRSGRRPDAVYETLTGFIPDLIEAGIDYVRSGGLT